ncbi:MAG: RNA 2',3'-cyclic phosphodiesterase [Elusimicrobiota bacterium]
MRLFVGIYLNNSIKKEIHRIQSKLKNKVENKKLKIKWVKPDKIHLTVKFLGETKKAKLPLINNKLKKAAQNISPFNIEFNRTGIFPKPSRPRVLWVGCDNIPAELQKLQKHINRQLTGLGFKPEGRPYIPHLTFGRIKKYSKKSRIVEVFNNIKVRPQNLSVNNLDLIKSTLKSSGSQYSTIKHVGFS